MKFDEQGWPVVKVTMDEQFDGAMVESYIENWERALSRNSRFGLLVVQAADKVARPEREATQRYMSWCKDNKTRIAQHCAAMAMVFPSSKLLLLYKPVAALSVRKMYGCAGKAFGNEAEAAEWLAAELQ